VWVGCGAWVVCFVLGGGWVEVDGAFEVVGGVCVVVGGVYGVVVGVVGGVYGVIVGVVGGVFGGGGCGRQPGYGMMIGTGIGTLGLGTKLGTPGATGAGLTGATGGVPPLPGDINCGGM
jgi:hypothetical protein